MNWNEYVDGFLNLISRYPAINVLLWALAAVVIAVVVFTLLKVVVWVLVIAVLFETLRNGRIAKREKENKHDEPGAP